MTPSGVEIWKFFQLCSVPHKGQQTAVDAGITKTNSGAHTRTGTLLHFIVAWLTNFLANELTLSLNVAFVSKFSSCGLFYLNKRFT
jgi:hypothetical protein